MLKYYQELGKLRNESSALQVGTYEKVKSHSHIYAYKRKYENETILVVVNLGKKQVKAKFDLNGELLLSNYDYSSKTPDLVYLKPYEARILRI